MRVGAHWEACQGPSFDHWLQKELSPFLLCPSFLICEMGEDPYQGTKKLLGLIVAI